MSCPVGGAHRCHVPLRIQLLAHRDDGADIHAQACHLRYIHHPVPTPLHVLHNIDHSIAIRFRDLQVRYCAIEHTSIVLLIIASHHRLLKVFEASRLLRMVLLVGGHPAAAVQPGVLRGLSAGHLELLQRPHPRRGALPQAVLRREVRAVRPVHRHRHPRHRVSSVGEEATITSCCRRSNNNKKKKLLLLLKKGTTS